MENKLTKINPMETRIFKASEALPYLDAIAKLRITVFAEYPYLYDGNLEYEKAYLEKFFESQGSILGVTFDGEKVVGGFTSLPFKDETEELQKPFLDHNEDINKYFYVSEGLLLPEYRKLGVGAEAGITGIKLAQEAGYEYICLCSVIRPENHPNRPEKYRSMDTFYQMFGFEKLENYIGKISWKDHHENEESEKDLQFWRLKIKD